MFGSHDQDDESRLVDPAPATHDVAARTNVVALPAPATDSVSRVPIASLLRADSPRQGGVNAEHVQMLASVDTDVPPLVVHRPTMRVIDGMHRLQAAIHRGQDMIDVTYFDGSESDAFVLAVRLNSAHGLPLSPGDRTTAAERVVRTHPQWSDRMIAGLTGLSPKTVSSIRERATEEIPQSHNRVGTDGRARPLSTAHGRLVAGRLLSDRPEASLRAVAREAGVSVGTVRDVRRRLAQGQDLVPDRMRDRQHQDLRTQAECDSDGPAPGSTPDRGPDAVLAQAPVPLAAFRESLEAVEYLKQDPSLRLSESGRVLLRLITMHSTLLGTWERLVDGGVPTHCTTAVTRMAMTCAEVWRRLAVELEYASTSRPVAETGE